MEKPSKENLEKTQTFNYDPDKFKIAEKEVFIFCEGKYHQTKLNNNFFEKKIKSWSYHQELENHSKTP